MEWATVLSIPSVSSPATHLCWITCWAVFDIHCWVGTMENLNAEQAVIQCPAILPTSLCPPPGRMRECLEEGKEGERKKASKSA